MKRARREAGRAEKAPRMFNGEGRDQKRRRRTSGPKVINGRQNELLKPRGGEREGGTRPIPGIEKKR